MFFHRSRTILIQVILILTLGLSACGPLFGTRATPTPPGPTATPVPPTATPEPMALTVDGEGVTVVEFKAELVRYKSAQTALGKTVSDTDASKAVIEDLIAQVLLARGATAAGFELTDTALQARVDALTTQLGGVDKLSAWESGHGYTDASFHTALRRSTEAAWMRDKIAGAVPSSADQVHAQQILIFNADEAQTVLAQLKGGADFNGLALKYDPNAHGDLGWFPKGYLLDPKIEEAAFSLQPGQFSDVIQTDIGFHIIKVLEHDPQHTLSPDAYLSQQEQALKNWVAQQRTQATVVLAP